MDENILTIKNLKKVYYTKDDEITAIEDFSYNFKKESFIMIVGPSGCGKSTLLSLIGNLESITSGKIIKKKNIKIGYMLQEDALFPWRTILENCMLGPEISNDEKNLTKDEIIELLCKYGLKDFINKYPNELSGGMRQRVALIRTLAINPDILLLDEPFSALDYQTRLSVSEDVYNIIKKEKKTMIMVTHDLAEAISMADEIIIMSKRPSSIKKIIKIEMKNKATPINNRKQEEFKNYYEKIWKEIDYHV